MLEAKKKINTVAYLIQMTKSVIYLPLGTGTFDLPDTCSNEKLGKQRNSILIRIFASKAIFLTPGLSRTSLMRNAAR